MTYNVNWGNPNPKTALDAIAEADADVVLLQEITSEWRGLLEKRFRDVYAHRAFHTGGTGGIAVLSKLPIKREDLWHARNTGAFFPAQRIVFATPQGDVQVLNVHLRPAIEGGSWIKGFMSTPAVRQKEIAAHWQKIDKLPTIVAGDFNEDPTGLAIDFLAGHGLARVPTTGTKPQVTVIGRVRRGDVVSFETPGERTGHVARPVDPRRRSTRAWTKARRRCAISIAATSFGRRSSRWPTTSIAPSTTS